MSFQSVAPYVRPLLAAVRIGTLQIGKSSARSLISLSAPAREHLGDPDTVDVFSGDGDEAGKLLIQATEGGGEHAVTASPRGGYGQIRTALLPDAPGKCKPLGCKAEFGEAEDGTKTITVTLPW